MKITKKTLQNRVFHNPAVSTWEKYIEQFGIPNEVEESSSYSGITTKIERISDELQKIVDLEIRCGDSDDTRREELIMAISTIASNLRKLAEKYRDTTWHS